MRKLKPVRSQPQDIHTIVNSMENHALADIIHSQTRPVAAFILSICFIEQLSFFLYPLSDVEKPERFFREYMPEYRGIHLYHKARHSLVHNYSSKGLFDIDTQGFENVAYSYKNKMIYLNTYVFIRHLQAAFARAKVDLLQINSFHYRNALENSRYFPVLVHTPR